MDLAVAVAPLHKRKRMERYDLMFWLSTGLKG
jgi:hypothetical protein